MTLRRCRRFVLRYSRALCGWAALALYLVMALGLPIPTLVGKDVSKPFPCMHSQCGCRNADQCWRSCCCTTLAQRLAWAREHGIAPPPFVLAKVRVEKTETRKVAARSTTCCSKKATACRSAKQTSCCDKSLGAEQSAQDDSIVILQSLRCQGQAGNVFSLPAALPPVAVTWSFQPAPRSHGILPLPGATPLLAPPPVPPPQFVAIS